MMAERPQAAGSSYPQSLEEAKSYLLNRDRFLVVSHVNPDGDAAGSTLAVGQILGQLGKTFFMINEGPVPAKFNMLPGWGNILDYSTAAQTGEVPAFDCVIAVDCADYSRMGEVTRLYPGGIPLLNIDHHPTNDGYGSVNLVRPDAAATAEVLYDLAVTLNLDWKKPLAECIYTGLMTDTGGFRYSNTTPKVLAIASDMLARGAEGYMLADRLLEKLTFSQVAILQKALNTLSFSDDKRIAWMSLTTEDIQESGADNGALDGLVSYPRNIEGVEVGLLFKQISPKQVKVSLRSNRSVDVAAIAQRFGGGGHVRAAGCTVNETLQDAVARVLKEVGAALS